MKQHSSSRVWRNEVYHPKRLNYPSHASEIWGINIRNDLVCVQNTDTHLNIRMHLLNLNQGARWSRSQRTSLPLTKRNSLTWFNLFLPSFIKQIRYISITLKARSLDSLTNRTGKHWKQTYSSDDPLIPKLTINFHPCGPDLDSEFLGEWGWRREGKEKGKKDWFIKELNYLIFLLLDLSLRQSITKRREYISTHSIIRLVTRNNTKWSFGGPHC